MRIIVALLIAVAVVGGVLAYNRREKAPVPVAQSASVAQPAAGKKPSQHNWPKNALDRAADVKQQVSAQRNANAADEK